MEITSYSQKVIAHYYDGTSMEGRDGNLHESIDSRSVRSICDAVGERLQQALQLESLHSAPRLQKLLQDLRRRDFEERARPPHWPAP